MAQPNLLTSTGRTNLENPPPPTTPPEAAPRVAQLTPEDKGTTAPSIGSLQQAGLALQTGMAVEKGILALANLLPAFAGVARQIIPLIRAGIQAGLSQGGAQGTPAGGQAEELPAQSVSPLQQG